MKIVDVKPMVLRIPPMDEPCEWGYDAFLVQVITDQGIVGIGSSDTNPQAAKAAVLAPHSNHYSIGLKQILVGEDPLEIQRVWDRMYYYSNYFGRRGVVIHAMSAIDIALWDIASQYFNVPIHALLGGKKHDRIRVYGTLDDTHLAIDEACDRALQLKAAGLSSLKLGPHSTDHDAEYARLARFRDTLGGAFELELDVGASWRTFDVAAAGFRRFADLGLSFIEEPVLADETQAYADLSGLTATKVAGGESLTTRYEFATFIRDARPDIVQPDLTRCGGISEIRRIYDHATQNGCQVVPHDWSTAILIAATVQFLATVEAPPFFEYCLSESPIYTDLVTNKLPAVGGYVEVPDCVGLGVELNDDFIKRFEVVDV